MYYYEVCMVYANGRTTCVNVYPEELADQKAYCREGISAGWLISYDITQHED